MFHFSSSAVLDKLRHGETALSFKINLSCHRSVEIAALCRFDCIWICHEHVPGDFSTMEMQILAARANGADCLVRVERGSYSDLLKPLEANAAGIIVPHVASAAEAAEIVRNVRFHPVGKRPIDGGNSDALYCLAPFHDYIRHMNANRFVAFQIEDVEALDELDAIAGVEGFEILFFGPGDFSQSLGVPGELNHPEVIKARRLVAEAAARHGKFAGTVGGPENLAELESEGYRFINLGADVLAIGDYCRQIMKTIGRAGGGVQTRGAEVCERR